MTAPSSMNNFNVELQDPFYHSDVFMMFLFKILPCKKPYRHDWRVCPFAHGDETAKRRDPRVYKYTGVICPDAKKGRSCPRGDTCPCTHSLFEYWLHPTRFKTEICSRGSRCNRPFCFFAHKQTEIRKPNFRVQMQGLTCEAPMNVTLSPYSNSRFHGTGGHCTFNSEISCATTAALNRLTLLDASSVLQSRISRDGGSTSVQDSGSSCDIELSSATWNSLIGGAQGETNVAIGYNNNNSSMKESPRLELQSSSNGTSTLTQQQHCPVSKNSTFIPSFSMPLCPMLPQIPTMERNSVDWYGIPMRDSSFQLSSSARQPSSSTQMSEHQRFGIHKSSGISPRLMEMTNSTILEPRSFADESLNSNFHTPDASSSSGYDRSFLLATIRDVYQSMMIDSGNGNSISSSQFEANDQNTSEFIFNGDEGRSQPPPPPPPPPPQPFLQSMSCGTSGKMSKRMTNYVSDNTINEYNAGGNVYYGLDGLQNNCCVSPSVVNAPNQNLKSFEQMISTLLQADSDGTSRYFN